MEQFKIMKTGDSTSTSDTKLACSPWRTLPLELHFMILEHIFAKYHQSNDDYNFIQAKNVLPMLTVCKAWYPYARRMFYREIYFYKPSTYYRFATSILKGLRKDLGKLIKKVIFQVPWAYSPTVLRFASIERVVGVISICCPYISTVEIRTGDCAFGTLVETVSEIGKQPIISYCQTL